MPNHLHSLKTAHTHRLPAATLLAGLLCVMTPLSAGAGNAIYIDAGSDGSTGSIAIIQDKDNASNTVSGAGGMTTPFTVNGAWGNMSISQSGAHNALQGSITNQVSGSGSNSFAVTQTGGGNTVDAMVSADIGATGNSFQLNAQGSSNLHIGVYSTAVGSSVNTTISNVAAGGGGVYVQQAGTGANAAVDLTVKGGGFSLGNLSSPTIATSLAGFFNTSPGVAVYQTGSAAITATVTPSSNGYTAAITSSGNYRP